MRKPEHRLDLHQGTPAWLQRKKGADSQIGSSRGGKNTKIHAVVDALGNPVYLQLSAGNVNDCKAAIDVLSHVELAGSMVIGDRGYDSDEIMLYIEDQEAMHTIPPRSNRHDQRQYDKQRYMERHLVENFFCKLKHFRRVATRYDKLDIMFLSFIFFALIVDALL